MDVDRSAAKPAAAGAVKDGQILLQSESGFLVIMDRFARRLQQARVTAAEWFRKADLDKDGLLSQNEFVAEALKMPLGLETADLRVLFERLDKTGKKLLNEAEFTAILRVAEQKNIPLEQWRKDCFLRLALGIQWAGKEWKQVGCRTFGLAGAGGSWNRNAV